MLPLDDQGELRLDLLDETVEGAGQVKVVATGYVSNALGTVNPVERLSAWAHERGAIMVCDAAQAAPHRRIDVQALGVDFLAVSGHKMLGPSGIGFLWGRAELLQEMEPFLLGGHMIRKVGYEATSWGDLPAKFEAGTSPMAEAVGLGAAIDYLEEIGFEAIERHERELVTYALGELAEIPGVTTFGPPPERRAGIVLFDVEGVHPHDVAQIVDAEEGVAIRAGHHCCQPLMQKLGLPATNRASFYVYTVPDEVDRLAAGLRKVREVFA
jgi:cysteine desulfurase/selenocysteine lyase